MMATAAEKLISLVTECLSSGSSKLPADIRDDAAWRARMKEAVSGDPKAQEAVDAACDVVLLSAADGESKQNVYRECARETLRMLGQSPDIIPAVAG
ncbi:MAG: hypothetical protein LBR29_04550 [Methylobacteriaceae bacterium]|jgi:hypothetical protein|nr:hypothetical protein [Methylobacteriaceae bacterium]